MFENHEYAVLGGLNRARIGHTIGVISAIVSSLVVAGVLALVHIAQRLGWGQEIPSLILWPIGAGTIYAVLYWLFDRHIWKWPRLAGLLRVPNLAGKWRCIGQTVNPDKTPGWTWRGEVTIAQSWDRIRVRLSTEQSGSNSVSASLAYDEAAGFRLMYNYRNDPNIDEPELQSHSGFAELIFSPDLATASGEYFNGHGRYTFGTMQWVREV
jgi:hypothetical protein